MKTQLHRYARAAHRGARWLDERMPGWEHQINIGTLDLGDSDLCVLGQLGNVLAPGADFETVVLFSDGCRYPQLKALEGMKKNSDVVRHGFDVDDDDTLDTYEILSTVWREEILMRRNAA